MIISLYLVYCLSHIEAATNGPLVILYVRLIKIHIFLVYICWVGEGEP